MADPITLTSSTNQAVYDWWQGRCDGDTLPHAVDFAALGEYLESCVVLTVARDPEDFHYRFVGTRIDNFTFQPLTGKSMSALDAQKPPSQIWSACCAARDQRRPVSGMVPYVGPMKEFVHMEDVILPLSGDGVTVSELIASVDYFRSDDGRLPF